MDVGKLSSAGLKKLHEAVHRAMEIDDKTPPSQDKPFGVRQFSDWKQWSDELEAELQRRNIQFTKVKW